MVSKETDSCPFFQKRGKKESKRMVKIKRSKEDWESMWAFLPAGEIFPPASSSTLNGEDLALESGVFPAGEI